MICHFFLFASLSINHNLGTFSSVFSCIFLNLIINKYASVVDPKVRYDSFLFFPSSPSEVKCVLLNFVLSFCTCRVKEKLRILKYSLNIIGFSRYEVSHSHWIISFSFTFIDGGKTPKLQEWSGWYEYFQYLVFNGLDHYVKMIRSESCLFNTRDQCRSF